MLKSLLSRSFPNMGGGTEDKPLEFANDPKCFGFRVWGLGTTMNQKPSIPEALHAQRP